MIEMKKLAGYFLMVSDISDFCRDERILSQGRGSAANSVVCYALGITAVEPIANKLLFDASYPKSTSIIRTSISICHRETTVKR